MAKCFQLVSWIHTILGDQPGKSRQSRSTPSASPRTFGVNVALRDLGYAHHDVTAVEVISQMGI